MHKDYAHKHALLDVVAIASLVVAPWLDRSSRMLPPVCWTAAVALVVLAVMTDYPLGVAKALPADGHHSLESGLGAGLLFVSLLFGTMGSRLTQLILATLGIGLIGAGLHGLWVEGRSVEGHQRI